MIIGRKQQKRFKTRNVPVTCDAQHVKRLAVEGVPKDCLVLANVLRRSSKVLLQSGTPLVESYHAVHFMRPETSNWGPGLKTRLAFILFLAAIGQALHTKEMPH